MENRKGRLAKELVEPFYLKDPKLAELFENVNHQKRPIFIFQKEKKL